MRMRQFGTLAGDEQRNSRLEKFHLGGLSDLSYAIQKRVD